jgi:hypothetical protein
MKIECPNPDCQGKDQPLFATNAVFNEDRKIEEDSTKIQADCFECCHCQSPAQICGEDEAEQQRRDEKHGLYPGTEDIAN